MLQGDSAVQSYMVYPSYWRSLCDQLQERAVRKAYVCDFSFILYMRLWILL